MPLECECPDPECNGTALIYPIDGAVYNKNNKFINKNTCPKCGSRIEAEIKIIITRRSC